MQCKRIRIIMGLALAYTPLIWSFSASYAYEETGQLRSMSFEDGGSVCIEWDAAGRPTRVAQTGCAPLEIDRTSSGQLAQVECGDFQCLQESDAFGKVTRTQINDRVSEYEYDLVGRITRLKYPTETEAFYQYDADGRLLEAKTTAGHGARYEWDRMVWEGAVSADWREAA